MTRGEPVNERETDRQTERIFLRFSIASCRANNNIAFGRARARPGKFLQPYTQRMYIIHKRKFFKFDNEDVVYDRPFFFYIYFSKVRLNWC